MLSLNNYKNCLLVTGDTKEVKDTLKEIGGRWNGTLKGWIFKKDKKIDLLKIDGIVDNTDDNHMDTLNHLKEQDKEKMKGKTVYVLSQGNVFNFMDVYINLEDAKNAVDTVWCEQNDTPGVYEDEDCEYVIHEKKLL